MWVGVGCGFGCVGVGRVGVGAGVGAGAGVDGCDWVWSGARSGRKGRKESGGGGRTTVVARKCGATESERMPSTCKMSAMFSAFLQGTARLG